MTKPGAPRNPGKTGAQMNAEWRDKVNAQPATTKCAWCRWTHVGTASEGRDAYTLHRTTAHPEVRPRRIRRSNLQRFSLGDPAHRLEGTVRAGEVADMHRRRSA